MVRIVFLYLQINTLVRSKFINKKTSCNIAVVTLLFTFIYFVSHVFTNLKLISPDYNSPIKIFYYSDQLEKILRHLETILFTKDLWRKDRK